MKLYCVCWCIVNIMEHTMVYVIDEPAAAAFLWDLADCRDVPMGRCHTPIELMYAYHPEQIFSNNPEHRQQGKWRSCYFHPSLASLTARITGTGSDTADSNVARPQLLLPCSHRTAYHEQSNHTSLGAFTWIISTNRTAQSSTATATGTGIGTASVQY